jgi:hypothetical protein
MFESCPRCDHRPLPADQALPAACPGCGVILAKVAAARALAVPAPAAVPPGMAVAARPDDDVPRVVSLEMQVVAPPAERLASLARRWQAWLWLCFAAWGVQLMAMDPRIGGTFNSFLHLPLLIFHEAGHVLFMPFGQWLYVFGGTALQLVMPAVMCWALYVQKGDAFGASIAAWLFGVSVLDVAPYVYDARDPQLPLLGGGTGADRDGHDWMYLLGTLGQVDNSPAIGIAVWLLGCALVVAALAWGARELWRMTE